MYIFIRRFLWLTATNQKKKTPPSFGFLDGTITFQHFKLENPIQSSYELLWQELKNTDNNSVTIRNTMRRILESYSKISGKYADNCLIKNSQGQVFYNSLTSWINDGSHGVPDDLDVQPQDSMIAKYFDIFKDTFTRMGHAEHYDMMMRETKTAQCNSPKKN